MYDPSTTTITATITGANGAKFYNIIYTPPAGGGSEIRHDCLTSGGNGGNVTFTNSLVLPAGFATGVWTITVDEINHGQGCAGNPNRQATTSTTATISAGITVTKTADPTSLGEPGGDFTFSVNVHNDSSVDTVTLESLTDDLYGDLAGLGTCSVPQTIAPGGDYSCSFTGSFLGSSGDSQTDTVTASGTDDDNAPVSETGSATVSITDAASAGITVTKTADPTSLGEPGGDFTFSVNVHNDSSVDTVTLESLTDDLYGDLAGLGTCSVPQTIAPGGDYSCSFTGSFLGSPGDSQTDTVTASGTDDDNAPVSQTGSATVSITDAASAGITVTKTADPTSLGEPGGDFTFSVNVHNDSSVDTVTLESLTDDLYGDLAGLGTCSVPQTIAPGGDYSCSFTGSFLGSPGDSQTDTVTASGTDDDNAPVSETGSATVSITDAASAGITVTKTADPTSLGEPGGDFTFSVNVHNDSSVDTVTLESLTDDLYGDLAGLGTCSVPQTIAPGGDYSCSFTGSFLGSSGDSQTDTVTASGTDDDNAPVSETGSATVSITDAASAGITVTKTADPTSLGEPGGDFTFSVNVHNDSSVDTVTLESLTDDLYGDLAGLGTCSVPQTIAPGGDYSCSFTGSFLGSPGDSQTDTVTASGTDDDNAPVSQTGSATVSITDAASAGITVTKTADPTSLGEPGGDFTFSVNVHNDSSVDTVTLESLTDDLYGDLAGLGTCSVPQTIAPGGDYSCSFTGSFLGSPGDSQTDTVTASGTDDDNAPVSQTGSATVSITDAASAGITVTKTADPTSLGEPGGDFTFSVNVHNDSSVDTVTLESLTDDLYGDLAGLGTCSVPQTIAPGGDYSCSFTGSFLGSSGDSQTDTVTASGTDDDNAPVSETGSATVSITDAASAGITVTKTADPTSLGEPGGDFTFSVNVHNDSSVDTVTLESLTDDLYGDLAGLGTCSVPQTIAPGSDYSCSFTGSFLGSSGDSQTDTVTASGTDDDNAPVSETGSATVSITDAASAGITVTKTADPTSLGEPGGDFTFSVNVHNDSSVDTVTLESLTDDLYGDLAGLGTCSVPQTIAPGGDYSCSFTGSFLGSSGDSQTDTVTASGTDDDNAPVSETGSATVSITDAASAGITVTKTADPTSLGEPGGDFTFSVNVHNDSSVDTVTLESLTDDLYGDLAGLGTCSVPQTIAPGGDYSCSFTGSFLGSSGDSQTDTVTASGTDDDNAPVSETGSATVSITDAASAGITVTKTADPTSLGEPGGDFTFSVNVHNDSSVDTVTLESLTDDLYGDLAGLGTCSVPQTIAPGGDYSCSFTGSFLGSSGDSQTDTVTASGTDDDNAPVSETGSATVSITDAASAGITVTKTADPTSLGEPGGDFTFSVNVHNDSSVDTVTLESLTDDLYGDLAGQGTCSVPQTIAPGSDYSCSFTGSFLGGSGDSQTDTVTASGTDDDNAPVSETGSATVSITDAAAPGAIFSCQHTGQVANVDPIVSPGTPSKHLHIFYGARDVQTTETTADLRTHATTCVETSNHSAYWTPQATLNGQPLTIGTTAAGGGKHFLAYYRCVFGAACSSLQSFPDDFALVVGNANASNPYGESSFGEPHHLQVRTR